MMIMNGDLNDNTSYKEKMQKCTVEYVESLEEERRKIQVFQRELPLCLELVSQAIETCRKDLHLPEKSDCSEQTSSERPVLEQFIPIKRSFSHEDVQQNQQPKKVKINVTVISSRKDNNSKSSTDKSCKKSDWLRSVQLWNTYTPDPPTKLESPRKVAVVEVKKNGNGGAFHPFKKEKTSAAGVAQPSAASFTAETGGSNGGDGSKCDEKEEAAPRKNRRCWSTELHRRFLQALQQLGGAHVATPKQIRELMKVDALTNDEVKSHLQKYRLHTRRPSTLIHSNTPQAPQFVFVGGIWVPPPEYAAAVSTVTTSKTTGEVTPENSSENGVVFAPKAALPSALKKEVVSFKHSEKSNDLKLSERGNCRDGGGRSNSPATSSSTHTTTASPAF